MNDEIRTRRILHINAQSIRNKMNDLIAESVEYDIICITETWLQQEILNESITIPNFDNLYRKDRRNDAHGGVAIYVRSDLLSKQRKDLEIENLEAVWCEIMLGKKRILIGTFYRPPNSNIEHWATIEESIERAKSSDIPYIFILGDLNCNMLTPNSKLSVVIDSFNMTQLIKEPTHITNNSQPLIDIIVTTSIDLVL